jgi:hypothetical protein
MFISACSLNADTDGAGRRMPTASAITGALDRRATVSPGLRSLIGILGGRDDLDFDRGVLLEGIDRQFDPRVGRRLDANERLSIANVMGKVFAEIPENDRVEKLGFELGFHRRWDGADFLKHLENKIAVRYALGPETIAGVLGNTFGLEYPDNDSRRHWKLLITRSVTLPDPSSGGKGRRRRVRVTGLGRLPSCTAEGNDPIA